MTHNPIYIIKLTNDYIDLVANLHIRAEYETYNNSNPAVIANTSNLEGRRHIWKIAFCDPNTYLLGALTGDTRELVGFLSGNLRSSDRQAKLAGLYVLQRFQSLGYGKALLRTFVEAARVAGCEGMRASIPAKSFQGRDFFVSAGFEECNVHWIGQSEDSFEMIEVRCKNIEFLAQC